MVEAVHLQLLLLQLLFPFLLLHLEELVSLLSYPAFGSSIYSFKHSGPSWGSRSRWLWPCCGPGKWTDWRGSAANTSKPAVSGQGEGVPSSRRGREGGDSSRPCRDCAVSSVSTSCLHVQHGFVLWTAWPSCEGVWSWGGGCDCCCQG